MLTEILHLVHEITCLAEVLYKKLFWKASQNSEVITGSSHSEGFCQIGVPKNFAKFAGEHLCWSLFLIELTAWRPTTLSEKDSSTGVFAFCEFCKILRRAFLQKTSWRPLLKWRYFFFFFFFFFFFADQWALQPKKIYLVGQCYIRQRNSQPLSILCSYEN